MKLQVASFAFKQLHIGITFNLYFVVFVMALHFVPGIVLGRFYPFVRAHSLVFVAQFNLCDIVFGHFPPLLFFLFFLVVGLTNTHTHFYTTHTRTHTLTTCGARAGLASDSDSDTGIRIFLRHFSSPNPGQIHPFPANRLSFTVFFGLLCPYCFPFQSRRYDNILLFRGARIFFLVSGQHIRMVI